MYGLSKRMSHQFLLTSVKVESACYFAKAALMQIVSYQSHNAQCQAAENLLAASTMVACISATLSQWFSVLVRLLV